MILKEKSTPLVAPVLDLKPESWDWHMISSDWVKNTTKVALFSFAVNNIMRDVYVTARCIQPNVKKRMESRSIDYKRGKKKSHAVQQRKLFCAICIEDLQIVGTEELFEWYGMITHKVNEVQLLQRIILLWASGSKIYTSVLNQTCLECPLCEASPLVHPLPFLPC